MASSLNDVSYSNAVEISRIILLAIVPILMVLTILANSAYIITLWKKSALHTPSNMLLGALAMSDVLVAIVGEPLWMVKIFYTTNGRWFQTASQKAMVSTMYFFILLSFFNIVSVSIDRYVAVFHPFWYHAKATCKTHLMVAFAVYVVSIIAFTPLAIIAMKRANIVSYIYIALMGLSLIITSYCNMKIFTLIKTNTRQVTAITNSGNHHTSGHFEVRQKLEKNKAVIIAIITVLFFICYTPFTVYVAITDLNKPTPTNSEILAHYYTTIFVVFNSMINPTVYYARVRSVRNAFKEVICNRRSQLEEG